MSTPVGPYSPTVRAGEWLVVSGQVGLGPDGLVDGFAAQLSQALDNVKSLVEEAGLRLAQVAKTTVFLVSMDDYSEMNAIYTGFFDQHAGGHRPARSAVAVAALPIGAVVEVEAWVYASLG
jgi:2-iminobutanoate/2-iminopropanoate deaminase